MQEACIWRIIFPDKENTDMVARKSNACSRKSLEILGAEVKLGGGLLGGEDNMRVVETGL